MNRVCLFHWPHVKTVGNHEIDTLDPRPYLGEPSHWGASELVFGGLDRYSLPRSLFTAEGIDKLYRERHPGYMRFIADFIERFRDHDLIVMGTYNPVHPDILWRELKKPIKVLGFVDDPYSSHVRGTPYLWAFDGAFYISPSYDAQSNAREALARWGCAHTTWWPLIPFPMARPEPSDAFFANRATDLAYVGNVTGTKVDRLVELKRHFGPRLRVHGRWGMKGWIGVVRGVFGKAIYPHRVTGLTNDERTRLYFDTKIGLDLHMSPKPTETGNVRMYEVPAHGMMLLCDKAARDAHAQIFTPDVEAVFYDSVADAIAKAEHYAAHDAEREAIARAGFARFWRDYEFEANLTRFLDWCMTVPRRTPAA